MIAWNNPDGTPETRQWLHDLRDAGIPVVVVSNNKYERVKRAVEKFGIEFEAFALKPFTFGINRALKRYDVQPHEVVMIGDQLMTDIRLLSWSQVCLGQTLAKDGLYQYADQPLA